MKARSDRPICDTLPRTLVEIIVILIVISIYFVKYDFICGEMLIMESFIYNALHMHMHMHMGKHNQYRVTS